MARHFGAQRACIEPLFEEEASELQETLLPQTINLLSQTDTKDDQLPARLLEQYPALANVELHALWRVTRRDVKHHHGQSLLSATDGQLVGDNIGAAIGRNSPPLRNLFKKRSIEVGVIHHVQPPYRVQPPYVLQTPAPDTISAAADCISVADSGYGSVAHMSSASNNAASSRNSIINSEEFALGNVASTEVVYRSADVRSSATPKAPLDKTVLNDGLSSQHEPEATTSAACAELQESRKSIVDILSDEIDHSSEARRQMMRESSEQSDIVATATASPRSVSVYKPARDVLKQLRSGIEDLTDDSEAASESSRVGSKSPSGSFHLSRKNDVCGGAHSAETEPGDVAGDYGGSRECQDTLRSSVGDGASLSSTNHSSHKRSRTDDASDNPWRAEVVSGGKRAKLSCKRFMCCFHNGPGRKCSGTDDTISEVIKKLSEQHDTHVCDRCWTLKTKDGSSGLMIHANDDAHCLDHCLSPQCHKSSPSVGHRHLFDPEICKTKTSRVRPGDSEAVFRFIFQLVHPSLESPAEVTTDEYALHLDAKPRQGRRKLTREELTLRTDELEKRLEDGEAQNLALKARVLALEQALAASQDATNKGRETNLTLEKQTRRVTVMLSDALRTGDFRDPLAHKSLLERVQEDAPSALRFRSQSRQTPLEPTANQQQDLTPVSNGTDPLDQAQLDQMPWDKIFGDIAEIDTDLLDLGFLVQEPDVPFDFSQFPKSGHRTGIHETSMNPDFYNDEANMSSMESPIQNA